MLNNNIFGFENFIIVKTLPTKKTFCFFNFLNQIRKSTVDDYSVS